MRPVTGIILEVSIDTRQSWFARNCLQHSSNLPFWNWFRLLPVPQVLFSVPEVSSCRLSSWFVRGGIDGEFLSTLTFSLNMAMPGGVEATEGLQKVICVGGILDVLASAGSHRIDDDQRLVGISDGEHSRLCQGPAEKFNGTHSRRGIFFRNLNKNDNRVRSPHTQHDRIRCLNREIAAGQHRAGYAGAVHEGPEHCALVIVSGDDND